MLTDYIKKHIDKEEIFEYQLRVYRDSMETSIVTSLFLFPFSLVLLKHNKNIGNFITGVSGLTIGQSIIDSYYYYRYKKLTNK
jgi:hypothetical protein